MFAKQKEKRIIEPIFRGNYEKQVKVGRLPTASHQTARADCYGIFKGVKNNISRSLSEMSENKKKYAYWMKPSMVEEITEMLDMANATSKSDFVCQAVQFYIGYLHQQKCIDYLSPMLAQTIKSEIESVEKNISEMLFKLAVEQAKLSNVVAATNEIDNHSLSALNNLCAEEVARNNGIITFEDAYKFQRG